MVIEIQGEIIRTGVTKTGKNFLNILVARPDGQRDTVTVFTSKDGFKAGSQYKGKVDVFVKMCNEV